MKYTNNKPPMYIKSSGKLPKIILVTLRNAQFISVVLFCAAVFYTLYAISESAVENTRISENALLPGLVEEQFKDSWLVQHYTKQLTRHSNSRRELREYVVAELKRQQIEVYTRNTKKTNSTGAGAGENIYGIVRAFRAAPAESILLVCRLGESHINSMAIALTLASYAKQQIYWARDVIFLFVDGEKLATEAWMAAYHGHEHKFFDMDELQARGGFFIGAIVLDLVGTSYSHINIQYGMINGRLPNLDLVNLLVLLVEKFGVSPSVYNAVHHPTRVRHHYDYRTALLTFSRSIFYESFIEYEGLHSVIGGYGVNAVTLQARQSSPGKGKPFVEITRIAEGGLRSLNNILEKFHQSYFLYILTHPHRFISVAYYMPIIGLLILPMIFLALRDWFQIPNIEAKPALNIAITYLLAILFHALQIFLYSAQTNAGSIAMLTLALPVLPIFLFNQIQTNCHYYFTRLFVALNIALFIGALSLLNFSLALALAITLLPFAFFVLCSESFPKR
uniref:Glycosylphosphatidylinositol anchor attachment 1 protein n=1 Tax=Ditylenchus dipsaci TaxID=166011 RepID=A0A915E5M9_9BILA